MQQHTDYIRYAMQFAGMQISELVTVFNRQTGHTGWTSMRAYHDQALLDEFRRRGIDVSAVSEGQSISFARPVQYDQEGNRLVVRSKKLEVRS